MKSIWLPAVCLGILCLAGAPSQSPAKDNVADAKALAARIDHYIAARWAAQKIKPAAKSNDAKFFRRISLDLTGKIPNLTSIRDFIDDDTPDKRAAWVEDMLKSDDFPRHMANVFRQILLPQNNNFQFQFFSSNMELWLQDHFKKNTGYDKMVKELLTAAVFGQNGQVQANPSVFYQANEFKPESIAASTSRLFLGHKLECAQCHDHPFAKWTRKQFWEYTAFFAGISPQGGERTDVKEIKITGTDKMVKAKFLDGTEPKWQNGVSPRVTLAEWITRADNPYFAEATVNKIWAYFFGIGIIDPVDEPSDENQPSHPELLKELAREFAAHDFDLRYLIRAILASQAYQLTSASTDPSHKDIRQYARMAVRGLSPEQLFDSVVQAMKMQGVDQANQPRNNPFDQGTPRAQFLSRFADQERRSEMETSILQALFMMNGKFLTDALKNNEDLKYIAKSTIPLAKRVEQLYLMTLSRLPTTAESARMVKYAETRGKNGGMQKAFEDMLWALFNSAEFMLNH